MENETSSALKQPLEQIKGENESLRLLDFSNELAIDSEPESFWNWATTYRVGKIKSPIFGLALFGVMLVFIEQYLISKLLFPVGTGFIFVFLSFLILLGQSSLPTRLQIEIIASLFFLMLLWRCVDFVSNPIPYSKINPWTSTEKELPKALPQIPKKGVSHDKQ